jgi:prepilin signal peptidase PulO-like enzyme (type II secretory pathway)
MTAVSDVLIRRPYLLLAAACILAAFAIDVMTMKEPFLLIFTISGFSVLTAIMYFTKGTMLTDRKIAVILIAAGFLLRLIYILYTPITYRQHDVWTFSHDFGHAGYINIYT